MKEKLKMVAVFTLVWNYGPTRTKNREIYVTELGQNHVTAVFAWNSAHGQVTDTNFPDTRYFPAKIQCILS
jgi:hypothetical protein